MFPQIYLSKYVHIFSIEKSIRPKTCENVFSNGVEAWAEADDWYRAWICLLNGGTMSPWTIHSYAMIIITMTMITMISTHMFWCKLQTIIMMIFANC